MDQRERRIATARASRDLIGSFDKVSNPDHRTIAVHDRIVESITDICCRHLTSDGTSQPCFTPVQQECLKDISFHIAFVVDPRNQGPRTSLGRISEEIRHASWIVKITLALTLIAALAGSLQSIDYSVKFLSWMSGIHPSESTKPTQK